FEDFLLLLCVKRIMHANIKYARLLLSAFCGAVFSFTAFLPFNQFPVNFIFDIIVSLALTLICFGYKSRNLFLKTSGTLVIISLLFSGAMIFIYLAFSPRGMVIINNSVYFNISPLLLIILTLVIYFILFLFKKLYNNHTSSCLIHNVNILYKNNKYSVKCKTDSGCNVKEPFSGASVIIIEKSELEGIYIDEKLMRIIPFNSLGGNGIIYGFKADEIFIDDKKIDEEIYIGICDGIFKYEIKGLIPENIIKD
ncbi:MAG: sigma-E processing peptidase SpoIIGA, partial [Ruminococcus sp.]|nr:sigma-E processing peptidase SpoIIGA [Ruminococcus sp.]